MSKTVEQFSGKQGKKSKLPEKWSWVETSVWTDRMLAALENGVKGGKWFSLIDKISSVRTLTAAWEQVAGDRQEWTGSALIALGSIVPGI